MNGVCSPHSSNVGHVEVVFNWWQFVYVADWLDATYDRFTAKGEDSNLGYPQSFDLWSHHWYKMQHHYLKYTRLPDTQGIQAAQRKKRWTIHDYPVHQFCQGSALPWILPSCLPCAVVCLRHLGPWSWESDMRQPSCRIWYQLESTR